MRTCIQWMLLVGLVTGLLPARGAAEDPATDDPLAGAPELLADAIRSYAKDKGRWAYTEQSIRRNHKGDEKERRLARHDPSQPPDEQFVLLQQDGREPTAREIRKHRREAARHRKNEAKEKALGELLALSQAVIAAETENSVTFEIPLREIPGTRLPPEKFQVRIEVDRAARTLRMLEVLLRNPTRVFGVVNVKSGEVHVEFASVVSGYGPAATAIALNVGGTILRMPVGERLAITRTDFKRVTPYDERFQVDLGPLKILDF